ncbi:MAG: ABC transporter substrate-binding protein [Actinomycetota bacterium]
MTSTTARWRLLVLALALALMAAACGGDDGDDDASASASGSGTAEEDGATGTTAADSADAADGGEDAAPAGDAFPATITDAGGNEFSFDEAPVIGCAWYGCTESLAEMGIPVHAAILTADEVDSVFYSPMGAPEHVIEDFTNPEEWAATEVDVLVTRLPANPNLDALAEQVAPVFFLHYPAFSGFDEGTSDLTGVEAYYENYRLLGELTGRPDAGEAAIERYETFLANLAAAAPEGRAESTLSVMFDGDGYLILGPDNPFCDSLVTAGFGTCVGEAAGAQINAEQFLEYDPDYIFYGGFGTTYENRPADPVFDQLAAVQDGQIVNSDGNRHYCCSTRGLIASITEFVAKTAPETGIEAPPADHNAYDPSTNPLAG